MSEVSGLRERKKRRTRRAIAEAALRMFAERGYEQTTVAQIAAAAEVAPRTFFGYFASKEEVVFADTDERIQVLRDTLAALPAGTSPAQALQAWCDEVFADPDGGLFGPARDVRVELIMRRPELRGRAFERVFTAQSDFAGWLAAAYPALGPVEALTISGALIGGLVGAALASLEQGASPRQLRHALEQAIARLAPIADPSEARPVT